MAETCCDAPSADVEVLALMAADIALAQTLGWPEPVPLLATALHDPALRIGPEGRRIRFGAANRAAGQGIAGIRNRGDEESLACQLGYARAVARAHARALDLGRIDIQDSQSV